MRMLTHPNDPLQVFDNIRQVNHQKFYVYKSNNHNSILMDMLLIKS